MARLEFTRRLSIQPIQRTQRRARLRCGVAAIAVVSAAFLPTPAASAHDVVLHSTPQDGGTVAEFPRLIELEFSGVPQPQFNTVAVTEAGSGDLLFRGTPELDQQFVRLPVPADVHPGNGDYVVGFQITSSDGHATRGKTTFRVAADDASAVPQSSDRRATESEHVDSTTKTSPLPLASAVIFPIIVVIVGIEWWRRRVSTSPKDSPQKGQKK